MSAANVAQIIQLIIAPVVLITACTLIQNGILIRYGSVGQRMRNTAHERFELLYSGKPMNAFVHERLQQIDCQFPIFERRFRLLQKSVLTIYGAIAGFILDMFAISLSVAVSSSLIVAAILTIFLISTAILLVGVTFVCLEIQISHQALYYEIKRVQALKSTH